MLTRTARTVRAAGIALALSLTCATLAQQPLATPNYYTFQLHELEPGIEVLGTLSESDGQNFKDGSRLNLYALDADEGATYTLAIVSFDFEPTISVFDPDGNLVAFNDFGEEFGKVGTSFVAGTSGRHVIVVSGWTDIDLGSYTLTLADASRGSSAATPVTLPTSIESAITLDMAPPAGGFGGGAEYFSFDVDEELLLLASMTSFDVDAVLTLYDERGDIVATNDDDGFTTDSLLVALLEPGSYVLAASTYFSGEAGEYTLALETYYRR